MNEQNQPGGSWQYQGGGHDQNSLTPDNDPQLQYSATRQYDGTIRSVHWSASEFIAHEKSTKWYLALAGAAVLAAIIALLTTHDKITTGIIVLAALVFGYEAKRKPRQIEYVVNDKGITIGPRFISFHEFRSFAIMEDGPFPTINFFPLKRFAMTVSAYMDPKDEDTIIEIVADNLPIEDRDHDLLERLMRRIRF